MIIVVVNYESWDTILFFRLLIEAEYFNQVNRRPFARLRYTLLLLCVTCFVCTTIE